MIAELNSIQTKGIPTDGNGDPLAAVVTPVIDSNGSITGFVVGINFADYRIQDVDDAGTTKYYGYANVFGRWFILRENTTTKTYRYSAGNSGYAAAFTGRAGLTYDYIFNAY